MRLYGRDAHLWEALREHDDLREEGLALWDLLLSTHSNPIFSVLELGCGCGPLAASFPDEIDVLLTDLSPEMLAISQKRNPNRRHQILDMCNHDLSEYFDVILIHDAIMYVCSSEDRQRVFSLAAKRLNPGGLLLIKPDIISEDFEESVICGGGVSQDKTVTLTEWRYDSNPDDDVFSVAFSVMVRQEGLVDGFVETHRMALLSDREWRKAIASAGLKNIACGLHQVDGYVFLAQRND